MKIFIAPKKETKIIKGSMVEGYRIFLYLTIGTSYYRVLLITPNKLPKKLISKNLLKEMLKKADGLMECNKELPREVLEVGIEYRVPRINVNEVIELINERNLGRGGKRCLKKIKKEIET